MHHIYTDEEMLRRLKGRASIGSLWAIRHFEKLVEERKRALIVEARRDGWGWRELGLALGVSAQAVHQRWKRYLGVDEAGDDDEVED